MAAPIAACSGLPPARYTADEPVVIVGAGAAGLTAAWTLAKAGVPVVVYEASGRVGGRIWTFHGFNDDGQFIELGAELVDSNHDELRAVCRELGVGLDKFGDPLPGVAAELFHYRGQIFSEREFGPALKPLIDAVARARREISRDPDLSVTFDKPANAALYDRMTLAEFLDRQRDVGPWVREMVRVAYVGEMGTEAEMQSALNLILLMDPAYPHRLYGESDEAWRIRGGSSSMINALRDAFVRQTGGDGEAVLRLRHQLVAIRDNGRRLLLTFDHDGRKVDVAASRVVLTLPFTLLRIVDGVAALDLHPVKKRSIAEYGYGTNTKLMSDFTSRLWRTASNRLPAGDGFLTTDRGHQTFWDTSRDQQGGHGILTNFLGGKAGAAFQAASQRKAIEFLGALDPRYARAFTGRQLFMNWSQYRFALGSYSCPLAGQYTSFFGIEGRPELGGRLLFAGEHTSTVSSGFMNGAIESGLRAARQVTAGA